VDAHLLVDQVQRVIVVRQVMPERKDQQHQEVASAHQAQQDPLADQVYKVLPDKLDHKALQVTLVHLAKMRNTARVQIAVQVANKYLSTTHNNIIVAKYFCKRVFNHRKDLTNNAFI